MNPELKNLRDVSQKPRFIPVHGPAHGLIFPMMALAATSAAIGNSDETDGDEVARCLGDERVEN
jgi:hypothetical protein